MSLNQGGLTASSSKTAPQITSSSKTLNLPTGAVKYTEHCGPCAPPATLGVLGDIYLDLKTPALYGRCAAGWLVWPGPKSHAPVVHPTYPDRVLWASMEDVRCSWVASAKRRVITKTTKEVLATIIDRDERRRKRKAKEALAGMGEAKKARVSDASDAGPAAQVQLSNDAQKQSAAPLSKPVESPTSLAGMGEAKNVRVNASDAGHAAQVQSPNDVQKQPATPLSKRVESPASLDGMGAAKKAKVSDMNASGAGPAALVQPSNGAQKKPAVPLSKPVESPTSPAGMGAAKKARVADMNASDVGPAARVQPSNDAQKQPAAPLSKPVESPTSLTGTSEAKKARVSGMNASDAGPASRVQPSNDEQKQPAAPLSKPAKSPTSASRAKRTAPNSLASDTARKRQRVQSPSNERLSVADAEEAKQVEKVAKEAMRPVKKHLKYLGEQVSATRTEEVDKAVVTIGRHLEKVVEQKEVSGEDAAQWSRRLWAFTALFWPEAAEATSPEELYRELIAQPPTAPVSETTEVPEDVAEMRASQQLSPVPSNPPLLTPVSLPNPASTTITDEADPVLAELLAVMERNTVIFKSEAASSARSIASTSTRHRNTVQPARPAAMSTTSTKAAAADPGRQARPSQGRSRSGSATLMRRTDRSPSLPIDAPPPSIHKAAYSPLQASDARSRRSLAEPTAPNDGFAVAAEEGPSLSTIVELRNRYIGCQSEAVSQKQTNAGWTAEAAATALIEALTAAYDALKRENEGLKAENRRLSGDVLIEPERMEPEEEEVVREEDRSAETPVGDMMQEIEESVVQNTPPVVASDAVKVKEEKLSVCIPPEIVAPPKTRLSGRGMPPSMGAEVIDLTLDDSDDEDAHVPIPPPATSSASMPVAPAAVVDNSDPLVDEIMQDEPVPNDSVPMDEETDPLGDSMDLEPPLDVESRSNTMDIDEDLDAPTSAEAPPDTTGLVVPSISAPGHFRIDDTDYDYPDARLTELVLLNGAQNDPTTHDWGTILAHLQLTDKRSSNKPFSVEVWRATVDALREYYMQFLAPYVDTAPKLQQREESDTLILGASVSNPGTPPAAHDRDSVVDEGHESALRGRTPGSETRATLKIAIDHSRSPPITTPTTIGSDDPRLLDPSECRTALPLPNVKIEQDAVQGLGLEIGDGVRCQPGGRRLKQMHLDIVFPRCGGQFLECVMCLGDGEKYEWPYQSPLDVLSAHVEKTHPEIFELILIQTAGMNAIQMQEWFAQLEE